MTNVENILDSKGTLWVVRIILPTVLGIVISVLSWAVTRQIESTDRLTITVSQIAISVDHLQQFAELTTKQLDSQIRDMKEKTTDIEQRVRLLERVPQILQQAPRR